MTDKGTIWYKAYDEHGNPVSVTVTEETAVHELFEVYNQALEVMGDYGLQLKPEGVEDGEKLEEITAWVLGENSKDEPCIFLYSSHEALEYKTATVWVESIASLPLDVNVNGNRWPGTAPKREMAEKKNVLNTVPPFNIVMERYEAKDKDGNQVLRHKFSRVHNATEKKTEAPKQRNWTQEQLQAVINSGAADVAPHANNILNNSNIAAPNDDASWCEWYGKGYAKVKAEGLDTEAAAKRANEAYMKATN